MMDLEVVGRHALLFDDDAMASFVNSGDALVEWNSLLIDRYDVRHLLSGPLPPGRRRNPQTSPHLIESSHNSELDHERYLDLPPPSDEPAEEAEKPGDAGGYRAVAFSYENTNGSADQNDADGGLECAKFFPPFPVPESLLHSLPPSEKVHQIIARTAKFVSKHGGQSEIVLRVKQGDNPTFGFLMPDHNLHAYFTFLVDHQELLQSDSDGKTQSLDETADTNQNKAGVGGALSLLGSVYGSGEDEEDANETGNAVPDKVMNTTSSVVSHGSEKTDSSSNAPEKKEPLAKRPVHTNDKLSALKKNPSIAASKPGRTTNVKKDHVSGSYLASSEKLKEPLFLEPPSDLKRLIDKVVDFVLKNGKQFEAALREQDSKQGRFPFLVLSDQYHPYYLKSLQKAQESKVSAKNTYGEDDSARLGLDKNEYMSSNYLCSDIPDESDRKEKFKMIIGKSRKDLQDPPSKATQQDCGVSLDAEAAAAILQAATRGFRIPNSVSSSTARSDNSGGHDKDVGQASGFGSNSLGYKAEEKAAVFETSGGADSEAHLTREQKLKAERLKRAKMFVAMLKSGAVPSKTEPLRALSVEPSEPGVSGSPAEVNDGIKERECSSAPTDIIMLEKNENPERNSLSDERRSKRNYRSRPERCEENDDENNDEEELEQDNSKEEHEGGQDEERKNHKHSRKKHHSHHSSREKDYDDDYKKEKSHRRSRKRHRSHRSSHEDDDGEKDTDTSYHKQSSKKHSSRRSSHEKEDKKDHKHCRKKHQSYRSSHRSGGSPKRQKVYSSEDGDIQLKKRDCSSSPENEHYDRYVGDRKRSYSEKDELEEGEISPKFSDHSRVAGGHHSRETSVDMASTYSRASSQPSETTQISDDLRAKIRAMLMTTR
nr:splicing factor, suppressor of white-apricot homolog isoform X2 [Coffea arabica]